MADAINGTTRNLLRRTLPEPILRVLRMVRDLPPGSRAVLPRVWLRRWLLRPGGLPKDLPTQPAILVVCHGNILRSAFGAGLLRLLGATRVSSAGTSAREGHPADPRGVRVAQTLGVDLTSHRARRLTPAMLSDADLILVMDYLNEANVVALNPAAYSKVRLLGSFADPHRRPREIGDPYTGSEADVEAAFATVNGAVRSLATALSLEARGPQGNIPAPGARPDPGHPPDRVQ